VTASAWTLGVTARIIHPGETPENILESLVKRLGLPPCAPRTAGDAACWLPFRARADHRGGIAAGRPPSRPALLVRHARGRRAHGGGRPGAILTPMRTPSTRNRGAPAPAMPPCRIGGRAFRSSLSAPPTRASRRISRTRVLDERCRPVIELARKGASSRAQFTVDAEEADGWSSRSTCSAPCWPIRRCGGWEGFGLAVQAYQKRAPAVIDWLEATAHAHRPPSHGAAGQGRAYWDTEVKRAQERGLAEYPGSPARAMTRSLLHRVHPQAVGGAPAPLSAVCHPQ